MIARQAGRNGLGPLLPSPCPHPVLTPEHSPVSSHLVLNSTSGLGLPGHLSRSRQMQDCVNVTKDQGVLSTQIPELLDVRLDDILPVSSLFIIATKCQRKTM